jgi:threonine dehydrogenase-like Zn-dependent dehydrogenase
MGFMGATEVGGYSERVAADEKMLHRLPEEIPLEYAAVVEPLAVVWHAIKVSGIEDWSDKSVLVLGGGPIGFALSLCLKARKPGRIFVSEPTLTRRKQISQFVDHALNPMEEDVGKRCVELTEGRGVDVIFDCAGVSPALEAGMAAIRANGLYVMVAVWEKPVRNLAPDAKI